MSLPPSEIPQGAIRFNTDSQKLEFYAQGEWWNMVSDTPNLGRGADTTAGARGLILGGLAGSLSSLIEYINISSTGNAQTFGDLTQARRRLPSSGCASNTRGVVGSGFDGSNRLNRIDYVTISSTGNAIYFGDLNVTRSTAGAVSNQTRAVFAGGTLNAPADTAPTNTMDYITIASTGDAQDFGDLTYAVDGANGVQSSTRGVYAGGISVFSPLLNSTQIQYITISTLGDTQDFGDLSIAKRNCTGGSNSTRGVFGGGYTPSSTNVLEYITIASLGNSINFGDLSRSCGPNGSMTSSTRAVWAGGYAQPENLMDDMMYITIQTQGNSVDFGVLSAGRASSAGLSNAHGGL